MNAITTAPKAPTPVTVSDAFAVAMAHHKAGRLNDAVAWYRKIREAEPDNPDALHLLGIALVRLGGIAEGLPLIEQSIAVRPGFADAHYNLGNALVQAGRPAEAVAQLRQALALAPGLDGARDVLALAYERAVYAEACTEVPPEGDVVLYQNKPGLGDNLLYSTLPERFAAQGRRFWVSDQNRARNPEIDDLVWGRNPHVAGRSTALCNAGTPVVVKHWTQNSPTINWLTRMEKIHGLEPLNDLPRVYYRPERHASLAGAVLVDLHSKTVRYSPETMRSFLDFIKRRFHYRDAELVQVGFKDASIADANADLGPMPRYAVESIFDYCDAIASARALITVHSGANSLAAALKHDAPGPAIHCAVDTEHFNQKCYIWRNIDYTIV